MQMMTKGQINLRTKFCVHATQVDLRSQLRYMSQFLSRPYPKLSLMILIESDERNLDEGTNQPLSRTSFHDTS